MRFVENAIPEELDVHGPRMKVIGAGISRCATSSLQAALEDEALGFAPCIHMAHIIPNPARARLVIAALQEHDREARHKILHRIFDGFQATTDFPGFWFIDDLMDMYPEAQIVLNQRVGGGESWFQSFENSLGFFRTKTYLALCLLHETDRLHYRMHSVIRQEWDRRWPVPLGPAFYERYQEYVLEEAAKRGRKVLLWKAQEGWEPLCAFLERPVPKDKPFPNVNNAAVIRELKKVWIVRGLKSWAMLLAGTGAVYLAGSWLARTAIAR